MSLVVVTEAGVSREWPRAPPRVPHANQSLPALNVRAIDFLYSNR